MTRKNSGTYEYKNLKQLCHVWNIMNRCQIDVVNTYAYNIAVDENEDHETSIEKCTQRE